MTLTEFLTARLDEDAAAAQTAYDRPSGYRILGTPETEGHFALWKPLRVLAEVHAKRRIVQLHDVASIARRSSSGVAATLRTVLRLLALPYADHPDYQQEWKP